MNLLFKTKAITIIIEKLRLVYLFILLTSVSIASFGWGRTGHHAIVDIAQNYVSKSTLDSISKYLTNDTWHASSTWMDELRGNSQFDYMRKWHYINIDKGQAYSPTIENGDNVVTQLDSAIFNLKNRRNLAPEQVKQNLKVLFHLMGDLHNPLHVGYGFDRGGNDVRVVFNDKSFSLHRIWDTEIIETNKYFKDNISNRLKETKRRELKRIAKGNATTWFIDSRNALPAVYTLSSDTITTDYLEQGHPVAEKLIFLAGVRLGFTLNDIFSKY
jgi:hypothetical protein